MKIGLSFFAIFLLGVISLISIASGDFIIIPIVSIYGICKIVNISILEEY